MAIVLSYRPVTRCRSHACATAEIADAVEAEIREKYGFEPVKRTETPALKLDPGGAVFGCDLDPIIIDLDGYTVSVHPSLVQPTISLIAARLGKVREYAGLPCFRMPAMYGLAVIPAGAEEALGAALAPYAGRGAAVRAEAIGHLLSTGAPVSGLSLPPTRGDA